MKDYILLRANEVEQVEKMALDKLESNKERPMSESYIEAKSVLDIIKWIRERNVYTMTLPSDNKIG